VAGTAVTGLPAARAMMFSRPSGGRGHVSQVRGFPGSRLDSKNGFDRRDRGPCREM